LAAAPVRRRSDGCCGNRRSACAAIARNFKPASGTPKWNPIEHRLFSQTSATWAGYVLGSLMILLGFIRKTTTRTGLTVTATHFDREYAKGVKVSDRELKSLNLVRHQVCPQWNYTIRPHPKITA
jgi:hypothetical protein